ncbi:PASTA domain-containing protein, partial [Streptomyces chryseus]
RPLSRARAAPPPPATPSHPPPPPPAPPPPPPRPPPPALNDEQLDAMPPQGRAAVTHDGAEDRTSVIPRAVHTTGATTGGTDDEPLNRTSRLQTPPPGPAAPRRTPARALAPRRGMFAVVAAVLLALGIGAGVWYINSGQFTRVPSLLGQTEKEATKRLSAAGLDVKKVQRAYSETYDRGTVMNSDPASRARIRDNGSVTLVVSRGPRTVKVPDVGGLPLAEAKAELKKAALAPGIVTRAFDDDVPQGSVVRTDPRAGTERHPDSAIAVVVSKGTRIEVPDVTGESVEDATSELEDAGFAVEVASARITSPHAAGAVAKQSADESSGLAKGDTVTLTVSKGPRMVPVPDVVGESVDDAKRALREAGFEVEVDRPFLSFSDEIAGQSVEEGDKAPEGSTITIRTKGGL